MKKQVKRQSVSQNSAASIEGTMPSPNSTPHGSNSNLASAPGVIDEKKLSVLEQVYAMKGELTEDETKNLASNLGMSVALVREWFEKKRLQRSENDMTALLSVPLFRSPPQTIMMIPQQVSVQSRPVKVAIPKNQFAAPSGYPQIASLPIATRVPVFPSVPHIVKASMVVPIAQAASPQVKQPVPKAQKAQPKPQAKETPPAKQAEMVKVEVQALTPPSKVVNHDQDFKLEFETILDSTTVWTPFMDEMAGLFGDASLLKSPIQNTPTKTITKKKSEEMLGDTMEPMSSNKRSKLHQ
ncbi:hypothetical protein MP638_004780 [Amoeboaphelidium occidentale]|nr:hypothetical protein MP638_004780 [Amoeboaphelidium occidentale]